MTQNADLVKHRPLLEMATHTGRYLARCDCGWISDSRPALLFAIEDYGDHRAAIALAPNGSSEI